MDKRVIRNMLSPESGDYSLQVVLSDSFKLTSLLIKTYGCIEKAEAKVFDLIGKPKKTTTSPTNWITQKGLFVPVQVHHEPLMFLLIDCGYNEEEVIDESFVSEGRFQTSISYVFGWVRMADDYSYMFRKKITFEQLYAIKSLVQFPGTRLYWDVIELRRSDSGTYKDLEKFIEDNNLLESKR